MEFRDLDTIDKLLTIAVAILAIIGFTFVCLVAGMTVSQLLQLRLGL